MVTFCVSEVCLLASFIQLGTFPALGMRSPWVSHHCLSTQPFTEVRDMHNISTLKVPTPTIFFVSSANFYQPSPSDMKATLKTLKEHAVVFWNWRKSRRPAQSKAEALVILHRLLLCPWSSQSVPSISPLCCYLCSKGQLLHLKIFFSFFFFLFSFFLFHFFSFFPPYFLFPFFLLLSSFFSFREFNVFDRFLI